MFDKVIRKIRNKCEELFPQYPKRDFGRIGPHCKIGRDSALVPQNIFMDDYSIIQDRNNFISYDGKLILGKYSVISSGCIIVPGNHQPVVGVPFYVATMTHIGDDSRTIEIGEDVWVGAGCILLPKSKIGRGAIVGAGSLVTKEIPPYAVAVGNPAKLVASKFSKEMIIEHEKSLYDENERMSWADIEALFEGPLSGLPVLKNAELTEKDRLSLSNSLREFGIR